MTLTFSIRNAESVEGAPAEFRMDGGNATIGRSANCDWTLPDARNYVSSRHCEIRSSDKGYVLKDISTNGTFVNDSAERMAGEHVLADGDVVKIGQYEVVAHVAVAKAAVAETPAAAAPAVEHERTMIEPAAPPADPDRTIFAPAASAPPVKVAAEEVAHTVFELGAAPAPEPVQPAPPRDEPRADVVADGKSSTEQVELWEKVASANAIDWERGGFGKDDGAAMTQAMVAATADELANAFLAAAGVPRDKVSADAPEAIVKGGSLLRRLVAGLVIMVEARARAKSQMGAEATQLQLDGNNPIKFARTPEAAVTQLVNPTMNGFLDAEKAVEDAFIDLQSHQVATMAAIPGALRQTLERFSPGSIKRRAENMGILTRILPTARDAALWANYEREFGIVAGQSDEAFMEVFAKEFRKAYAKQIAKGRL